MRRRPQAQQGRPRVYRRSTRCVASRIQSHGALVHAISASDGSGGLKGGNGHRYHAGCFATPGVGCRGATDPPWCRDEGRRRGVKNTSLHEEAYTHTHTHTHARTHAHTNAPTSKRSGAQTRAHKDTRTHGRPLTHSNTGRETQAQSHTHAHVRTPAAPLLKRVAILVAVSAKAHLMSAGMRGHSVLV